MNENDNLTNNNFLEVYFLLLKPKNFYKFLSLYTIENKWMWGVDHMFGHYGIKTGTINKYSVLHDLPKSAETSAAINCLSQYLKAIHQRWCDSVAQSLSSFSYPIE